jgi:hypothetical protein
MTNERAGARRPSDAARERRRRPTPVRPIGELLTDYLRACGLEDVERARRMVDSWRAAVSPEVFRHTRLLRVREGVVHVGVSSSALLFELEGFRREEILAGLRERPGGYVRDVKFKLVALPETSGEGGARDAAEK